MKSVKVNSFFLFLFSFSLLLGQIPEKPEKIYPVVDNANLLTASEEQLLNTKLINHFNTTSTEILILTINSLEGQNENMAAAQVGEDWGIGEKEKDNGIVILVSKNDHKIAIQNGYGTNIYLTAGISKQIITNEITPYFKQNNFYGGLNKGIDAIFQTLEGKYNDRPKQEEDITISPIFIFLFIFILIMIFSKNGKGNNGKNGGGGYRRQLSPIDIILAGSGRSSWGGSSGGGFSGGFGGFGGFGGGGSFGGGGASGGW